MNVQENRCAYVLARTCCNECGTECGAKGNQLEGETCKPETTTWKIQNAMSAAPLAIAKNATIVDHTGKEGGEMAVLRKGSNDWTCLPDDPSTPSNDPMCLDKNAMDWAKAWKTHAEPSDALWCEARPYGLFNRSQFGRSLDHVERHPL
jgi:hypothetical protein